MLIQRTLDKKNAYAFASYLYRERGKYIYYQPLCEGVLAEATPETKGEAVCCLLGEMYEYFVGQPMYKGLLQDDSFDLTTRQEMVITRLCRVSKRKSRASSQDLRNQLVYLARVNDSVVANAWVGMESGRRDRLYEESDIQRARTCAGAVRELADRYLA